MDDFIVYGILTGIAAIDAMIIALRGIKDASRAATIRFFLPLLCLLGCLLLYSSYIALPVLQAVGIGIIGIMTVYVFGDACAELFVRIKNKYFNENRYIKLMPQYMKEISAAIGVMKKRRTGALMIIERKDSLDAFISKGVAFDAEIKAEALVALFSTPSPVHDGAIIVRKGRITNVKTVLPISTNRALPMGVGTRHRSAQSISEKTDALAIIVSEERGEASLAVSGVLHKIHSENEFSKMIYQVLKGKELTTGTPKKSCAQQQAT